MKLTPPPAAGLAVEKFPRPDQSDRFASQDGRSQRTRPLMRKYGIAHLTPNGDFHEVSRLAPASRPFEDCFAAFGRGAILQTLNGPTAIEDIYPGDTVQTTTSGPQQVLWKGTMAIVPGTQNSRPEMGTMTRVTADALGLGRPSPDLVLGPAARLLHNAPGVRTLTGADSALVPVRDFIDQSQIIELNPMAPVHVYQLGFADHERVNVNGVEIETLHPGPVHSLRLRSDMQGLLMTLFPHKKSLADFGGMRHPRIRLRDLDVFDFA